MYLDVEDGAPGLAMDGLWSCDRCVLSLHRELLGEKVVLLHLEVTMDLSPCTNLKIHISKGMRVAVESLQVWLLGSRGTNKRD